MQPCSVYALRLSWHVDLTCVWSSGALTLVSGVGADRQHLDTRLTPDSPEETSSEPPHSQKSHRPRPLRQTRRSSAGCRRYASTQTCRLLFLF